MALIRLPGFIDIHTHLREPGATHKEDFASASRAAALGGFTFLCDMPNNYAVPTTTISRLEEKTRLSEKKSVIDIGFHFGTDGNNTDQFVFAAKNSNVFGLKVYMGETTGDLVIREEAVLDRIFSSWNSTKPILVHAEAVMVELALSLARTYHRRLHVCHVADLRDLERIKTAREMGYDVTVGVTPHHVFLSLHDAKHLKGYGFVKPPLVDDDTRAALWEAVIRGQIDIIESDHAPHTREEKESVSPPFGVPGLETTLGLCLKAVQEEKITLGRVIDLLYTNPKDIFSIPIQEQTFVELDIDMPYVVGADGYQTKCQWSPFDGWELYGKVKNVLLREKSLVKDGRCV